MLFQSLKPDGDATQLLTQVGIIPTPTPTGDVQSPETCIEGTMNADEYERWEGTRTGEEVEQGEELEPQLPGTEKNTEEPTVQRDEVLEIVRQIDTEVEPSSTAEIQEEVQAESISMDAETVNEAEQPLLTPEDVAADLVARDLEATVMDMGIDGDRTAGWNSTERVEKTTDEAPESREVVDEKEMTERVPPRDEAAEVGAAAVRTYQRWPAREETSGRKSTEEQPRRTPGERAVEDVNSAVAPPRRMRRALIDEEPEEDEDVIFTLIEALPSSGQVDPPAEVDDIEREWKDRKRKGKAIATPLKKKSRQVSTTLIIQEG